MVRLRADVVELAELRWLDVVVPAELLAAGVAEPRVHGRGDAERIEIRRRHELVVQRLHRTVPRPEVVDIDTHVRPQLPLERDIGLPVVVLQVEALTRVVCKARVATDDLPERAVTPRSALAVGQRVVEIAVGHELARAWITSTVERVVPRDRGARRLVGDGQVYGNACIALRIPA